MPESICICGQHLECDRQCAGSLAQQLECDRDGHLTAPPHLGFMDPDFCHRCGHRPAKDQATR